MCAASRAASASSRSPPASTSARALFAFDSPDPYWKAFLVGLANTLRVAIVGIVLTTILGTLLGIGRFSRNALVRGLCSGYVELFRNIPVLLQLLMWYLVFTELLPPVSEALHPLPGIFLSKSGMSFPVPVWEHGHLVTLAGFALGIVAAWLYRRWARAAFEQHGHARSHGLGCRWPSSSPARCSAGSPAARRRRWNCRCATTSTSRAAAR